MTKESAQLSIPYQDHFDRGVAGLVCAIACIALLFLLVKPDYWQFFAIAVALGVLIAIVLRVRGSELPSSIDGQGATPQYPHPGITMHQIRFGGGFAGLLFTIGCMLVFLFGTPGLWILFPSAIVLGVAIAMVLHFLHE